MPILPNVLRPQLAQDMVPVYVLVDMVSAVTSILSTVRVTNSARSLGCCPDRNIPHGSQRLGDHYKPVSHQPHSFWGAMGPHCRPPQQSLLWGSCRLKETLPE